MLYVGVCGCVGVYTSQQFNKLILTYTGVFFFLKFRLFRGSSNCKVSFSFLFVFNKSNSLTACYKTTLEHLIAVSETGQITSEPVSNSNLDSQNNLFPSLRLCVKYSCKYKNHSSTNSSIFELCKLSKFDRKLFLIKAWFLFLVWLDSLVDMKSWKKRKKNPIFTHSYHEAFWTYFEHKEIVIEISLIMLTLSFEWTYLKGNLYIVDFLRFGKTVSLCNRKGCALIQNVIWRA